jgi:hypothetical protein
VNVNEAAEALVRSKVSLIRREQELADAKAEVERLRAAQAEGTFDAYNYIYIYLHIYIL